MQIRYSYQGNEQVLDTDRAEVVIGRPKAGVMPDLDLSPDLTVSRRHARIWLDGGRAWIEDLESNRGTFVGEVNIAGKGRQPLPSGSPVRVGSTTLWLESPESIHPDFTADPALTLAAGTAPAPQDVPTRPEGNVTGTLDATVAGFFRDGPDKGRVARRAALLEELPLQFGTEGRLDHLLQTIVRRVIDALEGTTRGALLLKDRKTGHLLLTAHFPVAEPRVSMTMAERAIANKEGFIWERQPPSLSSPPGEEAGGGVDLPLSIVENLIEHVICAPLLWKDEALGVLWLDSSTSGYRYTREDLRLLLAVAHHAAMAVANQQLQDDLRQNAKILERLLANFSPEVGEKLKEQARRGRLRPGGTESEVTILCSDLRSFTKVTSGMEAEDVVDLLNCYFSALVKSVFRHGGTIDKFVGDAILAVFGSPEPDPLQHEHAVRAAVDMQETMKGVNRTRREEGYPTLELGIGLHCGKVLHGFIGSEDRMEFTVIGDAVNLASRYCDAAGEAQVLLSPEIYQRVWRIVKAEHTTIATKHEGRLPVFRLTQVTTAAVE